MFLHPQLTAVDIINILKSHCADYIFTYNYQTYKLGELGIKQRNLENPTNLQTLNNFKSIQIVCTTYCNSNRYLDDFQAISEYKVLNQQWLYSIGVSCPDILYL